LRLLSSLHLWRRERVGRDLWSFELKNMERERKCRERKRDGGRNG